jgi:hypothetical protein
MSLLPVEPAWLRIPLEAAHRSGMKPPAIPR